MGEKHGPNTQRGNAVWLHAPEVIISSTSTKAIQVAFAAEAVLNIAIAWPYILDPHSTLRDQLMQATPSNPQGIPSAESASLLQWIGMCTLTMSVPLILGVPNKPGTVEVRKAAYITIAALEVLWISAIVWQGAVLGDTISGLNGEKCLRQFVVPMGSFLLFRCWVLLVKPHWLGMYGSKTD
ncbi:hypothetical protein BGZ61DRAFT_467500 [Ilyonectria robusta]|uniref:uncharacterized protein n=1 Tax=Ilyonectria robusta TaxID=1079257 RepID=UPI001E8CD9A6|nr:uncharacterized protein BGZ61DRAFT_467500 [Ilyonectria robusta]KAH8654727.1 hypothetical protein BGZ61DRAFT_467500 [Ilyonectria robusta]